MKIGSLEAEIQKLVFFLCINDRRNFVSQLLMGRFSKFKNLNILEFNSKHIYIINLVFQPYLTSLKCQILQILRVKFLINFADTFFKLEELYHLDIQICLNLGCWLCCIKFSRKLAREQNFFIISENWLFLTNFFMFFCSKSLKKWFQSYILVKKLVHFMREPAKKISLKNMHFCGSYGNLPTF